MACAAAASSTMSAPAQLYSSYSPTRRAVYATSPSSSSSSSSSAISWGVSKSLLPLRFAPLSLIRFSPWSGLKALGISLAATSSRIDRRKRRQRRMVVYASLFGVGAPEALVIGVVALLVFGPKGLAEVARNLGKTLRAFQPTIRELQEVSREFKSTLEREIGLDDIPKQNMYDPSQTGSTSSSSTIARDEQPQSAVDPNGAPSSGQAYSSEEYLKITEEQLKLAQQQQQQNSQTSLSGENLPGSQSKPQVEETAATPPPPKSESGT
ncbi:hypothetical protein CRG98_027492 [Punica granatum]|nr:hypothetical protein CRG98_027492 [Punica granatum]